MKKKLVFLYGLLVVFIIFGLFALLQHFLPFLHAQDTEEAYGFIELQELAEVPESSHETNSNVRYNAELLTSMNDDFVGWLYLPDTTISFPVVMGEDNSFYLRHGFDKAYSTYGCPFLDTRTPIGGDNLVVHGHNMGNNRTEVFSPLLLFQKADYAENHKTAFFSVSGQEESQYELFAVVNYNFKGDFNYFVSTFEDPGHKEDYIRFLKEHSLYDSSFLPEDTILVLSTCNRTYGEDNRLLLCFGKK